MPLKKPKQESHSEEVKRWIEQAEEDLDTAKYNLEGKKYKVAIFLCQQSAEKSLKALLLKNTGRIRKIHDLVELGRELNISIEVLDGLKRLTLAYVYTRYPDISREDNLNEKADTFLNLSEEVLKWVKSRI